MPRGSLRRVSQTMMSIPRRRLSPVGLAITAVLVALVFTLPVTLPGPLHRRLVGAIGERFGGSVELKSLSISIFPRLTLRGENVVVRHKGRTDVPPLIKIHSFSAEATLFGVLRRPFRLTRVNLDRLEVNVPPGGLHIDDDDDDEPRSSPLIVDDLRADNAVVRILRREPGKRPREFAIARLSMRDTGATTPWAFDASLTNPTPPGRIEVTGTFGPWNTAEPAQTALAATYEFHNADLGHFDGIRGTLESEGAFRGVLERIEVEGSTHVADFALEDVNHPVRLETRFHSIVDGTNGNTWLRPVDGTFLNTVIHTVGGVVEPEGEDGRTVTLDVVMDKARIEDILHLAVKSKDPPMTGALTLRAKLELPPGHVDVLQKLNLDGLFEMTGARFGAGGIQTKVNELSQKARGEGDQRAGEVVSDFTGTFAMRGGVIRFSRITFAIPGARVNLTGAYAVRSEVLDFRGTVRLDAKLSELTSGGKAFFLKLIEPLFRRKRRHRSCRSRSAAPPRVRSSGSTSVVPLLRNSSRLSCLLAPARRIDTRERQQIDHRERARVPARQRRPPRAVLRRYELGSSSAARGTPRRRSARRRRRARARRPPRPP